MPGPAYLLISLMSYLPVELLFRLRAGGLDNVPRDGGAVVAANHTSNLDPWAIGLPLFPRRYLRFMAKSELKKWEARAHTGSARVARAAGVPLVPAAIKGADRLTRLGPLRVVYGAPIEQSEDPRETTQRLMEEIRRLEATL